MHNHCFLITGEDLIHKTLIQLRGDHTDNRHHNQTASIAIAPALIGE